MIAIFKHMSYRQCILVIYVYFLRGIGYTVVLVVLI